MSESRSVNTKRNIVSGVLFKGITIILPFLIRTAILYILGGEYVGLSSLFTSILQVLNLAELGFSNAIVYNMYKPIADKDTNKKKLNRKKIEKPNNKEDLGKLPLDDIDDLLDNIDLETFSLRDFEQTHSIDNSSLLSDTDYLRKHMK